MNERYIRWWTPHLSRDFEMLVFGDGGGIPLVLFPTAFGRHSQVSHLISLSGAFDICSFFDGYYYDNIYFNSPYDYMPNIDDPWKFNHMGIRHRHRRMGQHAA